MQTVAFQFGETQKHQCMIVFDYFGREQYFVDDVLVHKTWSLSPKGVREFSAGKHRLSIVLAVNFKRVECKVFVDGQLVAQDLFSELNAKFERMRNERTLLSRGAVWLLVAVAVFTVFRVLFSAS